MGFLSGIFGIDKISNSTSEAVASLNDFLAIFKQLQPGISAVLSSTQNSANSVSTAVNSANTLLESARPRVNSVLDKAHQVEEAAEATINRVGNSANTLFVSAGPRLNSVLDKAYQVEEAAEATINRVGNSANTLFVSAGPRLNSVLDKAYQVEEAAEATINRVGNSADAVSRTTINANNVLLDIANFVNKLRDTRFPSAIENFSEMLLQIELTVRQLQVLIATDVGNASHSICDILNKYRNFLEWFHDSSLDAKEQLVIQFYKRKAEFSSTVNKVLKDTRSLVEANCYEFANAVIKSIKEVKEKCSTDLNSRLAILDESANRLLSNLNSSARTLKMELCELGSEMVKLSKEFASDLRKEFLKKFNHFIFILNESSENSKLLNELTNSFSQLKIIVVTVNEVLIKTASLAENCEKTAKNASACLQNANNFFLGAHESEVFGKAASLAENCEETAKNTSSFLQNINNFIVKIDKNTSNIFSESKVILCFGFLGVFIGAVRNLLNQNSENSQTGIKYDISLSFLVTLMGYVFYKLIQFLFTQNEISSLPKLNWLKNPNAFFSKHQTALIPSGDNLKNFDFDGEVLEINNSHEIKIEMNNGTDVISKKYQMGDPFLKMVSFQLLNEKLLVIVPINTRFNLQKLITQINIYCFDLNLGIWSTYFNPIHQIHLTNLTLCQKIDDSLITIRAINIDSLEGWGTELSLVDGEPILSDWKSLENENNFLLSQHIKENQRRF